jgi:biotin transport system substrate-specific component
MTTTDEHAVSAPPATTSRTRNLVAAALVTAIMAALGPVSIAAGAVPITLQTFPVVLAALLLPAPWAAGALGMYLLLGAAGVPVYAHGQAGLGTLFGPTGGFIFGFVLAAGLGALTRRAVRSHFADAVADVAAAIVAIVAVYLAGWAWLAFGPAPMGGVAAFVAGVAPFLVVDAIKAFVAVIIAAAVRRATSAG